jgi:hypothetical protein
MERLSHEEVLDLLKDKLIFKYTPAKYRPMLMVSVMDLSDEMQDEIERRKFMPKVSGGRKVDVDVAVNRIAERDAMHDTERKAMREHIVFLGTQLEKERHRSKEKSDFLRRLLHPEDLGHAVTAEVRKLAWAIISNEFNEQRDQENKK